MTISGKDKIAQQGKEELDRIADISMQVRQAVRAALPAPAEQFFTMMIPGKVLNLKDFTGGFDAQGNAITVLSPNSVQLAEAILCDDMPALSGVQLAPTGRSVSRSYDATISKLSPAGSTTGIDDGTNDNALSDAQKRYKKAMTWLSSGDPNHPGSTRIDTYKEKQTVYTKAVEAKTKAFNDALDAAMKDPRNTTIALQRAAYDAWVSENQKTYRNFVQAAYMDWVTTGKKEETEYWFAIVDNDSAMSRVENSKEAMRASTISTTDGSAEYCKVELTPSNWASLAYKKAQGGHTGETVETLTYKIGRLQKINMVLKAMIDNPALIPAPAPPSGGSSPDESTIVAFLQANQTYQAAYRSYEEKVENKTNTDDDQKDLKSKFQAVNDARDKLTQQFANMDKANINNLNIQAQVAQLALLGKDSANLQKQTDANNVLILKYQGQLGKLQAGTSATDIQNAFASNAGIPTAPPDSPAAPITDNSDFWTSISFEVSSKYTADQSDSSSSSYSVGGGASWGLWSIGGSASHSSASAHAASQMANSSIKASFDCMRVDITRPWLRSELFYDDDLRVTPGNFISPGPVTLALLMDPNSYTAPEGFKPPLNVEQELQKYDLFPMYPTAFLMAANVVLEIDGETADIQSNFSTSTTSGSGSVGWGPFSVSTSFSHTETQASSTCEATATGCRITIKSPQIIGWVSEIVPALPRIAQ